MKKLIKYPLNSYKLSIELNPFNFWWRPRLTIRKDLTMRAKMDGAKYWWFRWGWIQISRSRWV